MLAALREGLRSRPDPTTGQPMTEDVLRRVTAFGGRFWREADALDIVLLGVQKRDEFLAQQIRIDRAGSAYLRNYHAVLWGEQFLPSFGASGRVLATGVPGTTWPGSTTVPDSFAAYATDPAGLRYQVLISGTADASGEAELVLAGIDGGDETNLVSGTLLKWVNPPPGSATTAPAIENFTGGLDAETDADFARRLSARVRHKPASGNWAHLRSYARAASVSVEDAFIYPCAFHAGSVLVAVTQKRGLELGPDARVPSFSVLSAVTAALVPPASPNVPGRAHVVVVGVNPAPCDIIVRLSQPYGSLVGWTDLEPFPKSHNGTVATVSQIFSPTEFRVTTSQPGQLPGNPGVGVPVTGVHLMRWDDETSSFESLDVTEIEELTPSETGRYRVTLAAAPTRAIALGEWISPDMNRRETLASAVSEYFDGLGPGEVVNLSTDERASRAFRHPVPNEEYPYRAGQQIVSVISEALGSPLSDALLVSNTESEPDLPADIVDGPSMIVAGQFAVYDFT